MAATWRSVFLAIAEGNETNATAASFSCVSCSMYGVLLLCSTTYSLHECAEDHAILGYAMSINPIRVASVLNFAGLRSSEPETTEI